MNLDEFKSGLNDLGISYSDRELNLLERYYLLLNEWNEKINLTAITDRNLVYLKHFYDSLTLVKGIDLSKVETLCDLGTGAGFPGIVLKIFFPHLKLYLVDALNKRVKFLSLVCDELGLEDVTIVHDRAEEYGKVHRECFDVVTARALSSFNVLLEYGMPLVKVGGTLCAMRGSNDSLGSDMACKALNGKISKVISFKLPYEESQRTLVLVQKKGICNKKYPRRYSEIKKKPL